MIKNNNKLNGGFPPLILKNIKIKSDNKERYFVSTIKNNLNIRQILQLKTGKNILDKNNTNKDNELEIINSL
jgi:hypothetical protein